MSWDETKSRCIAPTHASNADETEAKREEFATGWALIGKGREPFPVQLLAVDILNAEHKFNAVLMPRRSTKTTSIIAWALGRCHSRDDYLVAYGMMTTGKKARERFLKDVAAVLERKFPDPKTRPFKLYKSAGRTGIEWPNGSRFDVFGPIGDDYRSEAYNLIILDESGEPDKETTDDVLGAALPTLDTSLSAGHPPQLVVAGTAGKFRTTNLLWDELTKAREEGSRMGILDFSADPNLTAEDVATWEDVEPLVLAHHPGVGHGTPLEAVRDNYERLDREQFMREYLGVFGDLAGETGVFKPQSWRRRTSSVKAQDVELPDHWTMGWMVNYDQEAAAVVAAWRDDDGQSHGLVLDHRTGQPTWLAARVMELANKYNKRINIPHETQGGGNMVTLQEFQVPGIKGKYNLRPQTTAHIKAAAAQLVREVESGTFTHYGQDVLTDATNIAKRRKIGNGWAFGRRDERDDICALEALAMTLRAHDEYPRQKKLGVYAG